MKYNERIADSEVRSYRGYLLWYSIDQFRWMRKDIVDTFKPYKSLSYHLLRDLFQPLRALKNILMGLLLPVLGFICLAILIYNRLRNQSSGHSFNYKIDGSHISPWKIALGLIFLTTVPCFLRAMIQLATIPLILPRIIMRLIITAIRRQPKIEDDKKLVKFINIYASQDDRNNSAIHVIAHKIEKAHNRGCETNIPELIGPHGMKRGNMNHEAYKSKFNEKIKYFKENPEKNIYQKRNPFKLFHFTIDSLDSTSHEIIEFTKIFR